MNYMMIRSNENNFVLGVLFFIIIFIPFIPYIINVYKLTDCDFESPYKCEFVHGVGVIIPPASLVTVWFDDDLDE